MSWKEEYWKSIKSFDTEEKLDLYLYRPVGFLIAKIAWAIGATPTQLTLIGLVLGLISGRFFYLNETNLSLTIASVLFVLAGIFDSSDGQLARLGGKSTKLGLVLDGLCDNIVFAAAYIGSTLALSNWGAEIWPIAIFAGVCHSLQSSMLDFYNREYLYFGYGKVKGDYWNPTITEATRECEAAKGSERLFWNLRFSWIWQQNKLTSRGDAERFAWRALTSGPRGEEFQHLYREQNRFMLRCWRLMGANFHTIMIIVFAFARRFDLYLIAVDIVCLTLALLALRFFQSRVDAKFNAALKARGIV
ncbi:MAG: CDP-alcohol phosphatidyltransferase family protein [Bacteriovoracia bacterium]